MADTKDELTITLKFRGTPEAVVDALVNGLPENALRALKESLDVEMTRRAEREMVGSDL